MAVIAISVPEPVISFDGTICRTPDAGGDRVGTYVEVVKSESSRVSILAADPATPQGEDVMSFIRSNGWIEIGPTPERQDQKVKERLKANSPFFCHLFGVDADWRQWFEDWLDVALVDGDVPDPESGYTLDGTLQLLYKTSTSIRDAVALGKQQRSSEAHGGPATQGFVIQTVHPDVEAPVALFSRFIHEDATYRLYRPGGIFQTTLMDLVPHRGERFDRSTHFPIAGLTTA